MNAVDVILVLCAVVAAAVFLFWNLVVRQHKPACHAPGAAADAAPAVVLGASLQKGLERARARQSIKPARPSA